MSVTRVVHIIIFLFFGVNCFAQISPGDLSNSHSHLEGISHCTQCHILGEKVSNDKCLSCHKEIKERINLKKGYHFSNDVKGKECASCHNEHHGKSFQIIRFEKEKFEHNLTGFKLTGAHTKKKCEDCHDKKNIASKEIKDKKFTYLGLEKSCLGCHKDYHQKTLSDNCSKCHGDEKFKPALKFNHADAKFQLVGKHKNVDCKKCHKIEKNDDKDFQKFTGIEFKNCTNCHEDVHKNQFGENCTQCHSEQSFHEIKGISKFDHSKTKYQLENKHLSVNCKLCHKKSYTTPIKYQNCTDCHKDYHNGQFIKEEKSPDCSSCHNTTGFVNFSYTIEQHNKSIFALEGSHIATPCFDCHKKEEKWTFREIGKICNDCHKDIHQDFINKKYYPENNCKNCHVVNKWSEIIFDHAKTEFKLTGSHTKQTCSKCHFKENSDGSKQQKFANLSKDCANCHTDKHFKQFEKNGVTDCYKCHETENWKAVNFNHNNTEFKLDGKHENVSCTKCHKPKEENQNKFIQYKISIKCESCHS